MELNTRENVMMDLVKTKFELPVIEVIKFNDKDVITASEVGSQWKWDLKEDVWNIWG